MYYNYIFIDIYMMYILCIIFFLICKYIITLLHKVFLLHVRCNSGTYVLRESKHVYIIKKNTYFCPGPMQISLINYNKTSDKIFLKFI